MPLGEALDGPGPRRLLESGELERETGFEPATSTLARSHSTTELFPLDGLLKYHTAGLAIKRPSPAATASRTRPRAAPAGWPEAPPTERQRAAPSRPPRATSG